MTTEERFTKIENFLSTVAEHQAHFAEQQARMAEQQAQFAQDIHSTQEAQEELREMHKSLVVAVLKLIEAQREKEGKLHSLIETVDRINSNPKQNLQWR